MGCMVISRMRLRVAVAGWGGWWHLVQGSCCAPRTTHSVPSQPGGRTIHGSEDESDCAVGEGHGRPCRDAEEHAQGVNMRGRQLSRAVGMWCMATLAGQQVPTHSYSTPHPQSALTQQAHPPNVLQIRQLLGSRKGTNGEGAQPQPLLTTAHHPGCHDRRAKLPASHPAHLPTHLRQNQLYKAEQHRHLILLVEAAAQRGGYVLHALGANDAAERGTCRAASGRRWVRWAQQARACMRPCSAQLRHSATVLTSTPRTGAPGLRSERCLSRAHHAAQGCAALQSRRNEAQVRHRMVQSAVQASCVTAEQGHSQELVEQCMQAQCAFAAAPHKPAGPRASGASWSSPCALPPVPAHPHACPACAHRRGGTVRAPGHPHSTAQPA